LRKQREAWFEAASFLTESLTASRWHSVLTIRV